MTRDQKQRLAYAVTDIVASNMVDVWDEWIRNYGSDVADIDPNEAAQQIANWLGKLPTGDLWPTSLPLPSRK